jgi:hypothetical protein
MREVMGDDQERVERELSRERCWKRGVGREVLRC